MNKYSLTNRVIGIILIIFLIIILSCVYITREGFNTDSNSPILTSTAIDTSSTSASILEDDCTFGDNSGDEDCSNVITESGDEFEVRNVCPYDPRCLGICIDNFTWTDKNLSDLGAIGQGLQVEPGELKGTDNNHLIISSRCGECVKNFYKSAYILANTNACN